MLNPFEILGLPAKFDIGEDELEERYLELSRIYHPDFHSATPADDQVAVLQKSAAINDAYRILRDPWSRVEALIHLRDPSAMEATKSLCPMFLMEAMETREASLEESVEALPAMERTIQRRIDQYFRDVVARLEAGEVREAATLLHQSNYYRKALTDLLDRLRNAS
jgi:molecular chaperone HscB